MEIVWHGGRARAEDPLNSLRGLAEASASGARRIEFDVRLLADDGAALHHDDRLPDGRAIAELTGAEIAAAGIGTLEEAIGVLAGTGIEVQVDLKHERVLSDLEARRLAAILAPLGDCVVIGSLLDWNLRALHSVAPHLRLAFDPLLFFHYMPDREADLPIPFRAGAYDYFDDHFLASARHLPLVEYLRVRLEGLHAQVPAAGEIMMQYKTILRCLDDGVDPVSFFHDRGVAVLAWTLDAGAPDARAIFDRLQVAGVDYLVTNTPLDW